MEYSEEQPDAETLAKWEKRAPGWVIRCKKCGYTQHYGKYGIRRGAIGKKCILGYCRRCHRLCCHIIEKDPHYKKPTPDPDAENPYRQKL